MVKIPSLRSICPYRMNQNNNSNIIWSKKNSAKWPFSLLTGLCLINSNEWFRTILCKLGYFSRVEFLFDRSPSTFQFRINDCLPILDLAFISLPSLIIFYFDRTGGWIRISCLGWDEATFWSWCEVLRMPFHIKEEEPMNDWLLCWIVGRKGFQSAHWPVWIARNVGWRWNDFHAAVTQITWSVGCEKVMEYSGQRLWVVTSRKFKIIQCLSFCRPQRLGFLGRKQQFYNGWLLSFVSSLIVVYYSGNLE